MTTPWYVGNTGSFVATFRNAARQRADAEGVTITITRQDTGEAVPVDANLIAHDDVGVYRFDWTPAAAGDYLAVMRGVVDGWPEAVPVRVRIRAQGEAPVIG